MKRIAILFPDPHLPYSPTVLNLQKELAKYYSTDIIAFHHKHFGKVNEPFVNYVPLPFLLLKVYGAINKISLTAGRDVLSYIMRLTARSFFRRNNHYDHIIAVDPLSVWMLKDMGLRNVHLLSLELTYNTNDFISKINLASLQSIIIQSKERLQALAPTFKGNVFFIQNAPSFDVSQVKKTKPEKTELIVSGTAIDHFGLYSYLNFIDTYPQYRLTIKGKLIEKEKPKIEKEYGHLLAENRVVINQDYLSDKDLITKIGEYRIGFCFYDFSFKEIDNINYKTAPSGKMFTYFVAGVPVIGNNVPGLFPIRDFSAGQLIDTLEAEEIKKAIDKIELEYDKYVEGCYKAAAYYNFNEAVKPFIEFLK
ncbi:MAG TPA: hypothetical protein VLC98_17220 [Phnomibacter sp.]|nr:hypothetical protein [Phnomibacter sp.]